MALIHVPRPPQSAYDEDRPISSLLRMQVEHLYEAEKRLPSRYHTQIYVNAIKTEGEASRYIREVTEAIHSAHQDAERMRRAPRPRRGLEIAAVADERAERAQATKKSRPRAKKSPAKSAKPKNK